MSDRERKRGKGKESGGKEGSGGGDGEGEGGKGPKIGGDGKGFTFGRESQAKSSGFLVKHSEEDDIVKGWRDYFHKMNEKEPHLDPEERVKRIPRWRLVMGASFPTYVIRDRINRMWRPKDALKLIPLSNGLGEASGCSFEFYNVESLRRIGNMIGKMIKVDRSTSVYDKGGFARICVEIDLKKLLLPTYLVFGEERNIIYEGLHQVCFSCGKYGHQKVVCPMAKSQACSPEPNQGTTDAAPGSNDAVTKEASIGAGVVGGERVEKGAKGSDTGGEKSDQSTGPTGGRTVVTGGEDSDMSPFGKIRILRRDFRGALNSDKTRKVFNGYQSPIEDHKVAGDERESRHRIMQTEIVANVNGIKREDKKSKGPTKSEWVQVGSKRKNVSKGKLKGKENNPPARRPPRKSSLGHVLEPVSLNSFSILQGPATELEALIPNEADVQVGLGDTNSIATVSTMGNAKEARVMIKDITQERSSSGPMQALNSDVLIGTGAVSFPALVRDLKSHYKLNFIALLETRCSKEVSHGRASKLGFPIMELIDCEGSWSSDIAWPHNMSQFTTVCSKWNKEVFRHTEGRKKHLLRRLDGINRAVERVGLLPKYETLR
ncbi:hypothetical protein K1719_003364 [Acacia pycnantha]|nr:hypothetical protein K1719_003364 [Acacia pycnantha]